MQSFTWSIGIHWGACASANPETSISESGARHSRNSQWYWERVMLIPPYPEDWSCPCDTPAPQGVERADDLVTRKFLNCQGSLASTSSGKSRPRSSRGVQSEYAPVTV